MKKGPNPKIFVVLSLAAIVVGGAASFWSYNSLTDAKAHLAKLQADSKDEKHLQADLEKSKVSLDETTVKLQHLEQGVPSFAYVPTMLSELEKTGKSSGIDVIGVRPVVKPASAPKKDSEGGEQTPRRKAYEELDIEVKGRGSYRSVMNFIYALGKFPKVVAARTVDLTPKVELGQSTGTLDVTISLRAYIFAQKDEAAAKRTAAIAGVTHEG